MRKISSLFAIWAVFLTTLPTFANTRLQDDLITIGKPGSTANKRIKLGTQEIRSNTATSKLEYTHDGVTYKPIGSGSGAGGSSSGINLLANESFEDPITTGWQNTGGTLTQQAYTNGTETDSKFVRFVATAAGQYFESTLVTVPDNFTGGCQADFKKVNISADDLFKIEILDSSFNVLSTANVKKSTWQKFPTINTQCPTPGSQFRIRVTSLAAGTFEGDFGYLGSNQNLVSVAQAKLMGTVTITGCSTTWTTASTTFVDFPVSSGCVYTTSGQAQAPASQIPAIKFSHLPAGDYRLEYEGGAFEAASGTDQFLQFWDGTNTARETSHFYGSSSGIIFPGISQSISYTSPQSNVTLSIRGRVTAGGNIGIYGTTASPGVIKVWYFPTTTETAISVEQSSWLIDVNIGGPNPSLSTVRNSYTEITASTWDMVINTSRGSSTAEIPCQNTTASIGLTCSGVDESLGVVFTPPSAGKYDVCVYGSFQTNATQGDATLQLIETPNNAQTILQEGLTKVSIYASNGDVRHNISHCSSFTFSDTSKKTIRLMHEKETTGIINPLTDRSSTSGQRDIRFTVRPSLTNNGRPILTGDQLITPGATNPKFISASYGGATIKTVCATSTTCTLYNKIGNALLTVAQGTAGFFTATFDKYYSAINCAINPIASAAMVNVVNSGSDNPPSCSNCNSITFTTGNPTSAYANTYGTILCHAQ